MEEWDKNNKEDLDTDTGNDPSLWRMEGIDAAIGLEYAAGDAELYMEILSDYADCIEEQAKSIERAVAEKDIERYTIETHSLKSISRAVGAIELSNMAKELEDHGKRREWDAVIEGTPQLLDAYRRLYSVIMPYLGAG